MSELQKILTMTERHIGMQIKRIGLLIWPNEEGHDGADTKLVLSLHNDSMLITGTSADGQTPSLESQTNSKMYSFDELDKREQIWQTDEFWTDNKTLQHELFDVSNTLEYQDVVDSSIKEIGEIFSNVVYEIFCKIFVPFRFLIFRRL